MTDLARLALLLTDQKARDEAPCVPRPIKEGVRFLMRCGSLGMCWEHDKRWTSDGRYIQTPEHDCIATLDLPALVASAAKMREGLEEIAHEADEWLSDLETDHANGDVNDHQQHVARHFAKTARAALEEKP